MLRFVPKIAIWEITLACNMRCIHCGSVAGKARDEELSTQEALDLCDQLKELGCEYLTLSGGEPLVRQDWNVIAKHALQRGLKVYIITNGYLIEQNISKLLESGIRHVGISLDGVGAKHNAIRQVVDSYGRTVLAINRLKDKGFQVGIVTHISKLNIDELEAMYEELKRLCVDSWQIQTTFISGRMREHSESVAEPKDTEKVAKFIADVRARCELPVAAGDNIGYYTPYEQLIRDTPWSGCYAGCWLIGIESNGNIKGCLTLPSDFVEGNIRQRSLRDIWYDKNAFAYNRYFKVSDLSGGCKGCEYGASCRGGCRVTAFSATGNMFDNPYCLHRLSQESVIQPSLSCLVGQ